MLEHIAHGLVVRANRDERAVVNRHEREAAQSSTESTDHELQPMWYWGGHEQHAHAAKRDVEHDCDKPDSGTEQRRPPDIAGPEAGAARETEQRLCTDD